MDISLVNKMTGSRAAPNVVEQEPHNEDFSIFDNKNISKKRVDLNDFGHFMKDKK